MLRSLKKMLGYHLGAVDGELGKVRDFYFDDHAWAIRYVVVDTGNWLMDRLVLISPMSLGEADWSKKVLPVNLTRKQIEDSPPASEHEPVSREFEMELSHYFDWLAYWEPRSLPERTVEYDQRPEEPQLRSMEEVAGYHLHATDGDLGHVADFIADTDFWVIRYLVVDTGHWLPGRKALIAPEWITRIEWPRDRVDVDLQREQIRNSPEFDPDAPLSRQYEEALYDYYGRPAYWE